MAKSTAKTRVEAFIARQQAKEDRARAQRINRLRRGLAAADLRDDEITAIEQIVFLAYGRTKL